MTHPNLPPELESAFVMFKQELLQHMKVLHDEAALPHLSGADFESRRKRIEHRFHIIRGGAGFFQLPEISALCADGEKAFRAATAEPVFLEALRTLPEKLKAIDELRATMLPF